MTKQTEKWSSEFGKEYTDRNPLGADQMNEYYVKTYGVSRRDMNTVFLRDLPRDMKILEVGCNVGSQLDILQKMGFKNLYGIELQKYAVDLAKEHTNSINISQGSIFEIPFGDDYFDMVFTSGVLIHISPNDIQKAMLEMYRCAKKYIWGFEYYSDEPSEINYRGHKDLLWKDDFAQRYIETCKDLRLIKQEKYKYISSDNIDSMFLLSKK